MKRSILDPETHPAASASVAKYTPGVGGALPVHRHDKTEEFAYILSGEGAAVTIGDNGEEVEIPISAGYFWYNSYKRRRNASRDTRADLTTRGLQRSTGRL
jgi:hypothetical protein